MLFVLAKSVTPCSGLLYYGLTNQADAGSTACRPAGAARVGAAQPPDQDAERLDAQLAVLDRLVQELAAAGEELRQLAAEGPA